jgi:hypothetical protein
MGASDDLADNAHGGNRQNEDHYEDAYDPCWFHNVAGSGAFASAFIVSSLRDLG